MPKRAPIWKASELRKLKEMYENGCSLEEISTILKRSKSAIATQVERNGFRRRGRLGREEIRQLQEAVERLGLNVDLISPSPGVLKVCRYLAENLVGTKDCITKSLEFGPSLCNKAVKELRDAGLVFVDDFVNPRQFVLTANALKAGSSLSASRLLDHRGKLKAPATLKKILTDWIESLTGTPETKELYRCFIMQQLENVIDGDITLASFLALFSKHEDEC